MKILVIGSGGREHAICWKLRQSVHTSELYCAPGNAGIAEIATCMPVDVSNTAKLAELAESIAADLTIVGPEVPLVAGVAETFGAHGLRIIAPSQAAAQLEGSKIFAKKFMARHQIPTARFTICDTPDEAMKAQFDHYPFPCVVKADGLAAGKGVRLIYEPTDFEFAINAMMLDRVLGDAGEVVILEEFLKGREASLMIFTDGQDYKIIAPAQDYKRIYDGDRGPNTGGMGSFSRKSLIDAAMLERIKREIIEPTLEGMRAEGNPFRGILYFGLMFTADGPKVIEYNARFGDPETQAIMMRLDSDLVEIFEAILDHQIGATEIKWSDEPSVCLVASSGGYPADFKKGKVITGLNAANAVEGVTVFHAGTDMDKEGNFITSGGRVLGVTARAATIDEARRRVYEAIGKIHFDQMYYRKDIAKDQTHAKK